MPDASAFWWIGPAISGIGALASWAGYIASRRQRRVADQLAIDREYIQLANARENFWPALQEAYRDFRSNRGELPGQLKDLIMAAGPPPGLPRPGCTLRTWAAEEQRRFSADQRALWLFSSAVYPAHDDGRIGEGIDYSLVKREKARAFHKARDDLARFWNVWAPAIKTAHIVSHFEDARREIVVVSWLEPAWVLSTEDDGEGKKDLFRLAHRIMRS